MVRKINAEQFAKEALTGKAVVDFSATWCGPCRMMAPVLEQIAEEKIDVKFFNVDVDENTELAIRYGISSIPALLVLKDGQKQDMLVGFRPKPLLEADLEKALS